MLKLKPRLTLKRKTNNRYRTLFARSVAKKKYKEQSIENTGTKIEWKTDREDIDFPSSQLKRCGNAVETAEMGHDGTASGENAAESANVPGKGRRTGR